MATSQVLTALTSSALVLLATGVPLARSAHGSGAYGIGTITRDYTDPDRNSRPVPTDLYYPANQDGPGVPPADGVFPIVSFGHGFLIGADRYGYLAEGLARAGFIAALPRTEAGLFPNHAAFGLDLAFVLRALSAEGDDAGSPFFQHVAGTRAVMGHSMGGGASFLAADSDPEITAIANLAAAETSPSAIEAASRLTIPALLLAGDADCVTPPSDHQIPMYEALGSDCRTLATLIGASHCQFAETGSVCELGELGCGTPPLSRSQQHALVLELIVPWLRAQLESDPGAWDVFLSRLHQGDIAFLQDCQAASTPEGLAFGPSPNGHRVRAHPNPSNGDVRIHLELSAAVDDLLLLDASGRIVASKWVGTSRWESGLRWSGRDLELPSGLYWIVARSGRQVVGRGRLQRVR